MFVKREEIQRPTKTYDSLIIYILLYHAAREERETERDMERMCL